MNCPWCGAKIVSKIKLEIEGNWIKDLEDNDRWLYEPVMSIEYHCSRESCTIAGYPPKFPRDAEQLKVWLDKQLDEVIFNPVE